MARVYHDCCLRLCYIRCQGCRPLDACDHQVSGRTLERRRLDLAGRIQGLLEPISAICPPTTSTDDRTVTEEEAFTDEHRSPVHCSGCRRLCTSRFLIRRQSLLWQHSTEYGPHGRSRTNTFEATRWDDGNATTRPPPWLQDASEVKDQGHLVSEKFLDLEKKELARMKQALTYVANSASTGGVSKKYRVAGIEKGTKNRYNDIYPFDHSRVRLEGIPSGGCDYVNANHIQAEFSNRRYIATQAPVPDTFNVSHLLLFAFRH